MRCSDAAEHRGEEIEAEPQHELEASEDDLIVDAEIVSYDVGDPESDAWPVDEQPSPFAAAPPPDGMMSLEAAVSASRAIQRNALQHKAIRQ